MCNDLESASKHTSDPFLKIQKYSSSDIIFAILTGERFSTGGLSVYPWRLHINKSRGVKRKIKINYSPKVELKTTTDSNVAWPN